MGLQNEFKYIKNGNSFPDKNIVHKYYWIFLEKKLASGMWWVCMFSWTKPSKVSHTKSNASSSPEWLWLPKRKIKFTWLLKKTFCFLGLSGKDIILISLHCFMKLSSFHKAQSWESPVMFHSFLTVTDMNQVFPVLFTYHTDSSNWYSVRTKEQGTDWELYWERHMEMAARRSLTAERLYFGSEQSCSL